MSEKLGPQIQEEAVAEGGVTLDTFLNRNPHNIENKEEFYLNLSEFLRKERVHIQLREKVKKEKKEGVEGLADDGESSE